MGHSARRRADLNRMKAKARRIGRLVGKPDYEHHANHLAVCSCAGCGNPRRHFRERTLGELKFGQAAELNG